MLIMKSLLNGRCQQQWIRRPDAGVDSGGSLGTRPH